MALLVIDFLVIVCALYAWGMTGWSESYDSAGTGPSSASRVALQASGLLIAGAIITGGGLLAKGWRIAGIVQLVVLGGAAALFSFAAGG